MRRHIPFVVLLIPAVLVVLGGPLHGDDGDPLEDEARFVQLVQGLRESVVVVNVYTQGDPEGKTEICSTFCGIIFDDKGHVVTFGKGAVESSRIELRLLDGRRFEAIRLATDPRTEISVLTFTKPPAGLRPILLGDSDTLRVGNNLISIGSPFGFNHSVATGIVSGLDRVVHSRENAFTGMIQTTVPINPGDAGGLIANSRGECVGIIASTFGRAPSAGGLVEMLERLSSDPLQLERLQKELLKIQSDPELTFEEKMRRMADLFTRIQALVQEGDRSGGAERRPPSTESSLGAQALNFVMPINSVRWVADGLIAEGKVSRGFLGVGVESRFDSGIETIIVSSVTGEGPAEKAGIEMGDRIVGFLDEEIDRLEVLRRLIVRTPPGKRISLDVERNGERIRLEIVMGSSE